MPPTCSTLNGMKEAQMELQHKQVAITHGEVTVEVDEGMASLLEALWQRGIDTTASCQESDGGYAWVAFDAVEDAIRFQQLALDLEDCMASPGLADLWERAFFITKVGEGPHDRHFWNWVLNGDEEVAGEVHLYFPPSDIPLILEQLAT
jgi:hypothetical protein